jgi:hypothetical protein
MLVAELPEARQPGPERFDALVGQFLDPEDRFPRSVQRKPGALDSDADMRDLERCGNSLRRVAADVRVGGDDLRRLAPQSSGAAALLPHMTEALKLDPPSIPPEVLRDPQRVCSLGREQG